MEQEQAFEEQLKEVQNRLEAYRGKRRRRRRLPEPVWDSAVGLARTHGINRVARALRLDYYRLKRRIEATQKVTAPSPTKPGFLEVELDQVSQGAECRIELEEPNGSKMKIGLVGPGSEQLVSLVQAFWRRGT